MYICYLVDVISKYFMHIQHIVKYVMRNVLTLHFRYGRDDEELLGLRFCNEVVVAADQIHPPPKLDENGTSATGVSVEKDNQKPPSKGDGENKSNSGAIKPLNHPTEDEETLKNQSSVKRTNEAIHPTVSNLKNIK